MPIRCKLLVLAHPSQLGATDQNKAIVAQEIRLSASHTLPQVMREDGFESHSVPRAFVLQDPDGRKSGIGDDIYGQLRYCYSDSFSRIALTKAEDPLNKAALAYVKALPLDLPIILYWW